MTSTNLDILSINELLVEIPGGKIELRDDRIKAQWVEEIKPFFIGKYPVTQALYYQITNHNPSTFSGPNRPVETVSWKDAVIFCNDLSTLTDLEHCYHLSADKDSITFNPSANGFRLPTEAEWQFACQSGTNQIRYDELDKIAWYKDNSGNTTHEVGQKSPNTFGTYDMLGNVWEWCSDIYDQTVYGSYRIFRGAGWCDQQRSVMATTRRRSHPISFKIDDLGFRIARNI